jgi:hypothetical protein
MRVVSDPAECRLYVVDVKGGGTFLYDKIDVGRLVLRMAAEGDWRSFTVRPWPRWRRLLARAEDLRDRLTEVVA